MTPPADRSTARRRLGVGAVIVLIIAAFAVTVAIGAVRGSTGTQTVSPSPVASGIPSVPAVEAGLYVHIAGAVRQPGLYRLTMGARVADVVALAGGFADDAERGGVNLARLVQDGEQIVVPVVGVQPPPGATSSGDAAAGPLDLNTATAEQLDALPRIGPAIAERIVAWRDANRRFTSVDDLKSVPGIGDKMLAGLRDLVRV